MCANRGYAVRPAGPRAADLLRRDVQRIVAGSLRVLRAGQPARSRGPRTAGPGAGPREHRQRGAHAMVGSNRPQNVRRLAQADETGRRGQ